MLERRAGADTLSTMHRADYQRVLVDEARRLGAEIRLGCEVISVNSDSDSASVHLDSGEIVDADVVVGADGLHSQVRTAVLGYVKTPIPSGDIAYRITIPRELVEDDPDEFVRSIVFDRSERICKIDYQSRHLLTVLIA